MSDRAALLTANVLLLAVGAGLLPLLGVARTRQELVRRLPVAWLTGIAACAVVGTALAAAGVPYRWPGLAGTALLACIAGSATLRGAPESKLAGRWSWTRVDLAAGVIALACSAVVAVEAVRAFAVKPLVEYDGWAIWGLKAQALAELGPRGEVLTGAAYTPAHLEYPVGIPAVVSFPVDLAGGSGSNLVVTQTALIGAAGLMALWDLLRDRVRPAILLPALAAIATAPAVAEQLGTGYADLALAFLVAAGVVALGRWLLEDRTALLAHGALFLAAAAVAKNEGLLFAGAVLVSLLVVAGGRRRAVVLAGAAVAAALVPWRLFVAAHDLGTASDYDLSSSFDPGYVLGRAGRAPIALGRLLQEGFDVRSFGLLLLVSILAAAAGIALGSRPLGLFSALFTVLSFAGLAWIYVISSLGLPDYLDSSADRVVSTVVVAGAALAPLLVAGLSTRRGG